MRKFLAFLLVLPVFFVWFLFADCQPHISIIFNKPKQPDRCYCIFQSDNTANLIRELRNKFFHQFFFFMQQQKINFFSQKINIYDWNLSQYWFGRERPSTHIHKQKRPSTFFQRQLDSIRFINVNSLYKERSI